MANRWFAQGLQNFGNAAINYGSDNIKVSLVTSGYTPDTTSSGNEFYNAISGGNILTNGVSPNLTTKTNVGGIFDADNSVFTAVPSGTATQFVMWKDTGTTSTSPLMILWDTATNLPVTGNGGNITIQWPGSPGYIASLCQAMSEEDKALVHRFGWRNILEWTRGLGIPADRKSGGGIWIPTPTLVTG